MPRLLSHPRGFTIVELTVVLVIVSLILGGLMLSLTATRDVASLRDTQRQLTEIKDALLGFSAANGRLPCPASGTSNGLESFCTNDTGGCGALIIPPCRQAEPHLDHLARCRGVNNGDVDALAHCVGAP